MSWDISLSLDACEHCNRPDDWIEIRNLTWNNSAILSKLMAHPRDHEGKVAGTLIESLEAALKQSFEIESELRPLEPPNGWGGLTDCRDYIEKLLKTCKQYPKGTVRVW